LLLENFEQDFGLLVDGLADFWRKALYYNFVVLAFSLDEHEKFKNMKRKNNKKSCMLVFTELLLRGKG
jgi:hypothetical protein